MKKTDNSEKNNNLSLRPLSSPSGTTGRRAILLLGRHQGHCLRPPQRGKNMLTERMKNRGRRNTKAEERRRRTTVCHHSRPSRQ